MFIKKFTVCIIAMLCLFSTSCKKESLREDDQEIISMNPEVLTIEQNLIYGQFLEVAINGKAVDANLLDWYSLDESIASVDERGVVYGLWAGETEIIARFRAGKGEARCKIIVVDDKAYKFRLTLKNKGESHGSKNEPLKFLSQRAIDRRAQQNIQVDDADLPISSTYLRQIEAIGSQIVAKSKWLETVVVHCDNALLLDQYRKLPFVKEVAVVWRDDFQKSTAAGFSSSTEKGLFSSATGPSVFDREQYKESWNNLILNNGGVLHEKGFRGLGIAIAVIDAGYEKLNTNMLFSNSKIREVKSFIYEKPDPYLLDRHGVNVAGLMAVNMPSAYIGSAPDAEYWLFSTEDSSTEYPVEEDYLVAALEYADSVGVDLVNISLSYDIFDGLMGAYTFDDMDGRTTLASRAANIAFEKGMFIVSSAGNQNRWVSTPSDAPSVLTVGSVKADSTIKWFSSHGLTTDNRIKPDVVSLGLGVNIVEADGKISTDRYGTSFSTPIMTGLVACLWGAYPTLTNGQLFDVILRSANQYALPTLPYGNGLPDMDKAMLLAKEIVDKK